MYMILKWGKINKNYRGKSFYDPDYLDYIRNEDGSIKLFSLQEADDFANSREDSDDLRVISIEGVTI